MPDNTIYPNDDRCREVFNLVEASLVHFYKTAEKRPFKSFWQVGTAALTPMPIPEFTPVRWRARWDGIVV